MGEARSEQVEAVRALFAAFSARDAAVLTALVDPEAEFEAPSGDLDDADAPTERYTGHAGVLAYLADVTDLWEELRVETREFREDGDTVVVSGRVYAWGSGRVIDAPAAWLCRLRDGRLVYGRMLERPEEALASAHPAR